MDLTTRYRLWDSVPGLLARKGYDQAKKLQWALKGCPVPPPAIVKRETIVKIARECGLRALVETGTYQGDTIAFCLGDFESIVSIELSPEFAAIAQARFSSCPHVRILQGSSSQLIAKVLKELHGGAVFWLDAHYSGGMTTGSMENPILEELRSIMRCELSKSHVILVDDARYFGSDVEYPSLKAIETLAHDHGFDSIDVENDIVRIRATGRN